MDGKLYRRKFIAATAGTIFSTACATMNGGRPRGRLFFTSDGKTWLVNVDGSGLRALEFDVPNQATWQPGAFFPDGRRILLLSMEPRRDGPGRPFEEYYTQTPTHLWTFDLVSGDLVEIAKRDRLAVFYTPQLLLRDGRILVQVVRGKIGQVYNMNLDGSDARPFTKEGEGLPYGFSASPDGRRIAFADTNEVDRRFLPSVKIAFIDLPRVERLRFYLKLNRGGTVHTDEEIDRVRALITAEG